MTILHDEIFLQQRRVSGSVYPLQVIEEIEEMMQNSPDPEEEEEVLEEEDGEKPPPRRTPVLLQEMQALTQTFNNNWSYEGEGPGGGLGKDELSSAAGHVLHMPLIELPGSRELTSLFLLCISREVRITEGGEEAIKQN